MFVRSSFPMERMFCDSIREKDGMEMIASPSYPSQEKFERSRCPSHSLQLDLRPMKLDEDTDLSSLEDVSSEVEDIPIESELIRLKEV